MSGFGSAPTSPPPAAPTANSGFGSRPAVNTAEENEVAYSNPKVAELHTMFPTMDPSVIEIILESVGGSQDRAIEQLLSMTDENFKVEGGNTARREAEQQVDLDEAFARSLALQDQERSQRHQDPSTGGQGGQGAGYLPYQPRVKRNAPLPASGDQVYGGMQGGNRHYDERGRPAGLDERYQDRPDGQPQGQPGMLQMEQKLEQYAEVGKQTFNSLLSKAKAKYAEYQAAQAQNVAQGPGPAQNQNYNYGGQGQSQARNQAQMYGEESATGWTRAANTPGGGRGGSAGWSRDERSNSRSTSFSSESTFSRDNAEPETASAKPAIRQSAGRWNPSDSYVDSTPPAAPMAGSNKMDIVGGVGGRKSPGAGAGVSGSPGAKIDASKLGFLPKKKVDLLSTSPGASTTNLNSNSSLASGAMAAGSGAGSGARNSFEADPRAGADNTDPNPGLRTASADIIAKIPPTPPAGKSRFGSGGDSDDDLEYTRNPFDEK